jgi:FkbM family methyltransferase
MSTKSNILKDRLEKLKPLLKVVDTNNGPMAVYINDTIVSQSIAMFGEYSFNEIRVMSRYLNAESLYVDVGTNIGYHAMSVSQHIGCPVIGFEPHPSHFAVAAYNTQNKNIKLFNAAVSNKAGTLIIDDFDPNEIGNYGEVHIESKGVEVPAIKLDEVQDLKTICTVIKIDVEGNELNVLKGASRTIKKHRPVIFFEALEDSNWDKCREYLAERDYLMYWVVCKVKPLNETYKSPKEHPFANLAAFNILAVPTEKDQPDDLVPVLAGEWYHDMVKRITTYKLVM